MEDDAADVMARRMSAMRLDGEFADGNLRIDVDAPRAPAAHVGGQVAPHMAYWGGPFAAPLPPSHAAPPPSADDVAMPTRSPVAAGNRVVNTPMLPQAPKYDGSTVLDRRAFMRKYETYMHALTV